MFNNGPFYFDIVRKMVIYFGNCFNDLYITRQDESGNVAQLIKVPISYAQKNKMLLNFDSDPERQRLAAAILPRLSFEMTGLRYDANRQLIKVQRNVTKHPTDADKLRKQYIPVPYDFDFQLTAYVKNVSDGTKIIEQIVPFFTPDWTSTVYLVPEMNETRDIPIVMTGINPSDLFDGTMGERRVITWTMNFTVKGYLFGPIYNKPIIKFANTSLRSGSPGDDMLFGSIVVQPGLTANGTPTSNLAMSVNAHVIEIDDDFGFITTIVDNDVTLNGDDDE